MAERKDDLEWTKDLKSTYDILERAKVFATNSHYKQTIITQQLCDTCKGHELTVKTCKACNSTGKKIIPYIDVVEKVVELSVKIATNEVYDYLPVNDFSNVSFNLNDIDVVITEIMVVAYLHDIIIMDKTINPQFIKTYFGNAVFNYVEIITRGSVMRLFDYVMDLLSYKDPTLKIVMIADISTKMLYENNKLKLELMESCRWILRDSLGVNA